MGIKHNGVTTLTFLGHVTSSVTWPFESPCPVSDSAQLQRSLNRQQFWRYRPQNIWGSRPLTFRVMWRHPR